MGRVRRREGRRGKARQSSSQRSSVVHCHRHFATLQSFIQFFGEVSHSVHARGFLALLPACPLTCVRLGIPAASYSRGNVHRGVEPQMYVSTFPQACSTWLARHGGGGGVHVDAWVRASRYLPPARPADGACAGKGHGGIDMKRERANWRGETRREGGDGEAPFCFERERQEKKTTIGETARARVSSGQICGLACKDGRWLVAKRGVRGVSDVVEIGCWYDAFGRGRWASRLDAAAAAMDASGASGRRVEGSEAGREAITAEQRDRAERGVGREQPRGRDVSTEKRHGSLSSTKAVDNGLDAGKDVVCRSKTSPNDNNGNAASGDLPVDARRSGRSGSNSSSPRRFDGSERRRLSTTKPNEDQQPVAVAPQRGDDDVDDLHQTNPGSPPQSTRRRVSYYTRPGTTSSAASVIAAATAPLPSSSRSPRARAPSEPVPAPVLVAPRTQKPSSLPSGSTDPDAGTFADGGLLLRLEGLAAQLSAGASASGRSSSLPDVRTYGHGSAGASPRASKGRRRSDLAEAPRRRDGPGAAAGNTADKSSSKRKKQTGSSDDSSRIRHKHSSSLRRAYTLPALSKSNASLLSVFSELTQSSESTSTSSGSNSTVTQQSYECSPVTKRQLPSRKDGDGSDSCRPKHSVLREASSSKLAGEGGADQLKRQGRSSNPLARGVVEPSPPFARAASKHALMAGTATTNTVSVEKTATPRPVSVVRHSVSPDSDIPLRGSGPNTGDRNKIATTSGELETPQEMQDDEDRERELAIQRLVREIAQSPQLMAGADARLHKMMEQEEQLRLHIKQTSPEHPMPRDEPHFRRTDGGEGAFGPFPYNCSSSRTQQGARGGCYEDPPGRPALVPASEPSYYAGRAPAHSQYQPLAEHFAFSGGAGQQQHYQADLADFGRTTIAGYGKIALKLAEGPDGHPGDDDEHDAEKGRAPERHVRPLYRRFEYLQHRILLHIQDELSEMEEKLGEMDKWIAEQSTLRDQQGMAAPASRRLEARYGNDVHARRTLLLGDVYVKLGQYSE
ncbi:hypothetical protein BC567DRAFT_86610 [Phyllosticta citribraziliensis]